MDILSPLSETNAAGNFKIKSMLVYNSKNPRTFKNYGV